MAFRPGYYPNSLYCPDPWQTTWLPKHFPEHHYPLEHTRHAIGRAFSDIAHEFTNSWASEHAMICPRIDARESKTAFYIDVELPGLYSEKDMSLKWVSTRTLLLRADLRRPLTPEEKLEDQKNGERTTTPRETKVASDKEKDGSAVKLGRDTQTVYMTVGERHLGTFGRAFNFPVDVNHESTIAKLDAGLLRLTVTKAEEAIQVDKKVNVKTESGKITW